MKQSGVINTSRPAYDPLEDGYITAPRPNIYDQVQNFVHPAQRGAELLPSDSNVLTGAATAAGAMISQRQTTHHARSDDSALSIAFASIVASAPSWAFSAITTGALLLVGWWTMGSDRDGDLWLMAWLVIEGCIALYFFFRNREQTLHHSPSGIAHHEIDSREKVALATMHRHADIIERRLGLSRIVDIAPDRRLTDGR